MGYYNTMFQYNCEKLYFAEHNNLNRKKNKMILILLTLLLSLFVSLITLPLGYYSPEWILLVLIYWAIAIPSTSKIFLAFLSGFLVDIVLGQVLALLIFLMPGLQQLHSVCLHLH